MAEKYSKPDSKLYEGPVEEMCGDPKSRGGTDTKSGGMDIEGAPKESESQGIETVTFITGISPNTDKND
jgi:hypothetical protein